MIDPGMDNWGFHVLNNYWVHVHVVGNYQVHVVDNYQVHVDFRRRSYHDCNEVWLGSIVLVLELGLDE